MQRQKAGDSQMAQTDAQAASGAPETASGVANANGVPGTSMNLVDLLTAVNRIGGRLRNCDGVVRVEATGKSVPPELANAVQQHADELRQVVPESDAMAEPSPSQEADANAGAESEAITDEQFLAELKEMLARPIDDDVDEDLEAMFSEAERREREQKKT